MSMCFLYSMVVVFNLGPAFAESTSVGRTTNKSGARRIRSIVWLGGDTSH